MKKDKFLSFSELTRPDERMEEIVDSFNGSDREIVEQIIDWIAENLERKKPRKKSFRKRNARQIIESGYAENCSDEALVFIALARLSGIPTKYVYLLEGRRIKEDFSHRSGGHTVARCLLDDGWMYIDPSPKAFYGHFLGGEIDIPFDRWIHYHEGKNWKELGLDDWRKMMEAAEERPAICEIEIPEDIFEWAMEESEGSDKTPADMLRDLLEKGRKSFDS